MQCRVILTGSLLVMLLLAPASAQDESRRGERGWGRDRERSRERGFEDRLEGGRGRRGRFGGGPPGRGGWDPVARLDANQNGVIDQEEIDRIPDRIRVMMDANGFSLQSGESTDVVRGRMREQYERYRAERDRREREDEDGDGAGDSGRANRSTPPAPFRPRDRERITVDLPESYAELDSDLDGQLGLYEWIISRRSELELFDQIDRNGDGLLTPRELVAWETVKADAGKSTLTVRKRERLVIVGEVAAATDGSSGERGPGSGANGDDRSERSRRESDWIFGRMDRDKDGTISMDEWDSSRRIRPMFEDAGVAIRPMSASEFASTYERVSRSRDGGRRRR